MNTTNITDKSTFVQLKDWCRQALAIIWTNADLD